MMLLEGIELSTSPLPKHSFRLRLLKLLAFPLLESRRVTIRSRVFGASGTGNSTGDPVSHAAADRRWAVASAEAPGRGSSRGEPRQSVGSAARGLLSPVRASLCRSGQRHPTRGALSRGGASSPNTLRPPYWCECARSSANSASTEGPLACRSSRRACSSSRLIAASSSK